MDIEFSREQTDNMVARIKRYFEDELHQDIGSFDAEFLIQFFSKELGGTFYNRGLQDAHRCLQEKILEADYVIQELEQPEP
jgi:uncharacterized protein (DUF2164 family)